MRPNAFIRQRFRPVPKGREHTLPSVSQTVMATSGTIAVTGSVATVTLGDVASIIAGTGVVDAGGGSAVIVVSTGDIAAGTGTVAVAGSVATVETVGVSATVAAGTGTIAVAGTVATVTADAQAPVYRGVSSGSTAGAVTWPAGYTPTAGDYALIAAFDADGIPSITGSGWGSLSSGGTGGSTTFGRVSGKALLGSDALPVISTTAGAWAMVVVTGDGAEAATMTATVSGTSHQLTTGATTGARQRISFIAVDQFSISAIAGPNNYTGITAGWTERADFQGADNVTVGVATKAESASSSAGTVTWTSNFSEVCLGFTIAVGEQAPTLPGGSGSRLWDSNLESGNLDAYTTKFVPSGGSLANVVDPAGGTGRAARIVVSSSQTLDNGNVRVQAHGPSIIPSNSGEYWLGCAYLFKQTEIPNSVSSGFRWFTLNDVHGTPHTGSPMISVTPVHWQGQTLRLVWPRTSPYNDIGWLGPVIPDNWSTWLYVVYHLAPRTTATGFMEIYCKVGDNGSWVKQTLTAPNGGTLTDSNRRIENMITTGAGDATGPCYWKIAEYTHPDFFTTPWSATTYFKGHRIATSFESARPDLV